ncbi:hypothetical protein [Nonomuraea sp. NPDC049646]|uniref:hypothetical protein n=1 Tax=unclassified Nonomuraea TaxID=2593643 RepID=UPI0037A41D42
MRCFTDVSCRFYLRQSASGGYTYTGLGDGLDGSGALPTTHPPAVGDLVALGGGVYRVVDRLWVYPVYGSQYWPAAGLVGPLGVTVLVEAADGLFVQEVPVEVPEAGLASTTNTGHCDL